jgi:hypothetical protein
MYGFGYRNGQDRYQNQPIKVGCVAAHLFEVVLAQALVVSVPQAVDVWTSFDTKDIE